ncbi:MAG: hypothetical protein U0230_24280 [Polyangiales bacterium]
MRTALLGGLFITWVWLGPEPASAQWGLVDRATADRAVAWLALGGNVARIHCAACGDRTSELVRFDRARFRRVEGAYEVLLDERPIVAERTYVPRAGHWYNLAVLVQAELRGPTPTRLEDVLPDTPPPPDGAVVDARPHVPPTDEQRIARAVDVGLFGYLHSEGQSLVVLGSVSASFATGEPTLLSRGPWNIVGRRLSATAPPSFRALEGVRVRVFDQHGTACDVDAGPAYVVSIVSVDRARAEHEEPLRGGDAELIRTVEAIGESNTVLAVTVPSRCPDGVFATRAVDGSARRLSPLRRSARDRQYRALYRARPGYARERLEPRADGVASSELWVMRLDVGGGRELAFVTHTYESYGNADDDTVVIGSALYLREGTSIREAPDGSWDPGVVFALDDGTLVSLDSEGSTFHRLGILSLDSLRYEPLVGFYANDNLGE